jgi:hypothetical protein
VQGEVGPRKNSGQRKKLLKADKLEEAQASVEYY